MRMNQNLNLNLMRARFQVFKRNVLKVALVVVATQSSASYAFSPEYQASIFNAAMTAVDYRLAERLRTDTSYLRNTLDNSEALVLTQHSQLKIGTYLFLNQRWGQLTLEKALLLRGVELSFIEADLNQAGIDLKLLQIPINEFGSVAKPLLETCATVTNPLTASNVKVLYETLSQLELILAKRNDTNAALAMIVFMKASALIQMHDPLMTHAHTTAKCVSDLEGLISCADGFYEDRENIDNVMLGYRIDQVERRVLSSRLVQKMGENAGVNLLARCLVPMKLFASSAAMTNPLNDSQIVELSESLYKSKEVELIRSNSVDMDEIMRRNHEVVDFIYNFPKYAKDSNLQGTPQQLKKIRNEYLRERFYQHVERATINVKAMLTSSPSLTE